MRVRLLLVLWAVATLPTGGSAGQVVVATFDDLPLYASIYDYYPGMVMGASVRAKDWAKSAPHVAYSGSPRQPRFPGGALWLSFYEQNIGTIAVYDLAGTLMDFLAPVGTYPWTRVDLSYDRPIGSLDIISYDGLMGYYYLDDFSYEYIPEPASLAGLALGLAGLAGVVQRRRRR